jgi:hypothetical protein
VLTYCNFEVTGWELSCTELKLKLRCMSGEGHVLNCVYSAVNAWGE